MKRAIEVLHCSILDAGVDAVVNSSNPQAVLGGGVSRVLFNECGGPVLQQEMKEKVEAEFDGELDIDDCLVTSAGSSTRFKFVLHVPSVDYRSSSGQGRAAQASSAERVRRATESAVRAAAELGKKYGPIAVALPLLGAGSGGLSPGVSLKAMVDGLRALFKEEPDAPITRVVFAVPEPDKYEVVKSRLEQLLVLR